MDRAAELRRLHEEGFFVMPNAWDAGSAVRLERLGFAAIATTSSGFAWSLGKQDQQVTFDELCAHVAALTRAVSVPVSVDSERLYSDSLEGVAANARTLAALGAAGMSIEDYDPATASIDAVDVATARVAGAAEAAREHGAVLTARAENHLYGVDDLDDTIARLQSYAAAGADVVYAPGLTRADDITRLVNETGAWVNVLLLPGVPPPPELAALGVTQASTGGRLARVAYEAMEHHAATLRTDSERGRAGQ
jgi:2-methylisocitrate lyase-like PEP mutase family enzyme